MWQRAFLFLFCALTFAGCGELSSGRYGSNTATSLGPNGFTAARRGQGRCNSDPPDGTCVLALGQVLLQAAHLALPG